MDPTPKEDDSLIRKMVNGSVVTQNDNLARRMVAGSVDTINDNIVQEMITGSATADAKESKKWWTENSFCDTIIPYTRTE